MRVVGRILNSLNYQIASSLRESIHKNKEYKKNRWGVFENHIITWSKRPPYYVALLGLLLVTFTAAIYLWKYKIVELLPKNSFPIEEVVNWQANYLSGQLTILGLLFPLVVGLVGFLLQRKSASKAIWHLYKRYSGFVFLGLSGILLAILITGLSALGLSSNNDFNQILSVSFLLWFIANLVLIGWFLWVTVNVVEESSRDSLLVKFAVNEDFIADIKRSLSQHLPHRVINSFGFSDDRFEVLTFNYSSEGDVPFSVKFRSKKVVNNIHFRLLKLALWLTKRSNRNSDSARITIPLDGVRASTSFNLVVTNGLVLPWYCKVLIRLSFSFGKDKQVSSSELDNSISAVVGSVEDALSDERDRRFQEAVEVLEYMICQFINRLSFQDHNNSPDNWMLLPESPIAGSSYFDKLLRAVYLLGKSCAEKIPVSTRFFNEFAHVPHSIFSQANVSLPFAMSSKLLDSSYYLWTSLIAWSDTVDEKSSYLNKQFEDSIIDFIGRWESWPLYIAGRERRWAEDQRIGDLYLHHLTLTSQMVVSAVRHNSKKSGMWAVDSLNRWRADSSADLARRYFYSWNTEILVPQVLGKSVDSVEWQLIVADGQYDSSAAKYIARKNVWTDVRIITACYLLKRPNDQHDTEVLELVESLVAGSEIFPTGGISANRASINSGADILSAYIRQRWMWDRGDHNYGGWLDEFVEKLNKIDAPRRVLGRIYSGWGADDVRSLRKSYLELMILRSGAKWKLSGKWVNILFSDLVGLSDRESLISDLNHWVELIDKEYRVGPWVESGKKEKVDNCRSSIVGCIELLKETGEAEIVAAEVDPDRELKLSVAASSINIFDKTCRYFPLSLFSNVFETADPAVGSIRTLNIVNYAKSNITNVGANLAVNEDEWAESCIKQSITAEVLNTFINEANEESAEFKFENDKLALAQLERDIDLMSQEFVDLVIFTGADSMLTRLNCFSEMEQKANNVEYRDGYGESYSFHFNGVAVYSLPFTNTDFVLLTTAQVFDEAIFYKWPNGCYVDAKYIPVTKLDGKLSFRYRLKTNFRKKSVIKYVVNNPEVDDI